MRSGYSSLGAQVKNKTNEVKNAPVRDVNAERTTTFDLTRTSARTNSKREDRSSRIAISDSEYADFRPL
jgi:hypothetical protein